jgi:dolichol-phosphate mannosyltransferase
MMSVIVPLFNEEGNVLPLAAEIAAALTAAGQTFELLFVDDGSTDRTWQQVREAGQRFPVARGLRHARNFGQSAALWTGLQATTGPLVATLDGDGQNDPADLPRLVAELGSADFVCGVRRRRCDNWVRRGSSRVARAARRWVLGVDFEDTGCFLRVFQRSALDRLYPFDGWHRFLPVLVHGVGGAVKEVPVNHRPRRAGRSKYGVWNRLGRGIYDLFGVRWWLTRALRASHLDHRSADLAADPGSSPAATSRGSDPGR